MARPTDHERKRQLLDDVVDYAAANGIASLSLRPLATALGTQAPVLQHHFGSKEQLLAQIVNSTRDRVRSLGRDAEAGQTRAGLNAVWEWASDPEQFDIIRLFFETYALALRTPERYQEFLQHVVQDWLDEPLAAVDEISATIANATINGLLLDLLATGDRKRVNEAFARTQAMLHRHADSATGRS